MANTIVATASGTALAVTASPMMNICTRALKTLSLSAPKNCVALSQAKASRRRRRNLSKVHLMSGCPRRGLGAIVPSAAAFGEGIVSDRLHRG